MLNHPVKSVQIMGDVVSLKQKSRLVEYKGEYGVNQDFFVVTKSLVSSANRWSCAWGKGEKQTADGETYWLPFTTISIMFYIF